MESVATSDGVRLHVTDEGDGPAVMLIAGFTAAGTSWAFQVDALREAGCRVMCLDRRSHGESDAPWYGQRMARHGKDKHDALAALDLTDVAVVGGSMGASAIWSYVDLFGDGRLRGVLSVDQTPKMVNSADWAYGFYGCTDENASTFFANGVTPTGRGFTAEQMMPGLMRLVERLGEGGGLRRGIRPETLALLRDHALADWRDVIDRVRVPVLMRSVVIDDCGHMANLDQVETFNRHMLEFLESL
jgi:non-heme chloroperoxidase